MSYVVPNVPLIPQDMKMACWYACAQMLVTWKRERDQATSAGMSDPSQSVESVVRHAANNGITNQEIQSFARALGLACEPALATPTPETIQGWLKSYGPLWVNGKVHITVVAGIDIDNNQVWIHNPGPVGIGRKEWRPFTWLFGSAFDSMDTSTDSSVLFVHCP